MLMLILMALLFHSPPVVTSQVAQRTWGGTGGGTANAQTVTIVNVSSQPDLLGVLFSYLPANANTGSITLSVSGLAAQPVQKSGTGGLQSLQGQELQSGRAAVLMWDGTEYVLLNPFSISAPPTGQVYFSQVGSTQVRLCPFNGSSLVVNKISYQVPTSCISSSNTGVYVNGTPNQNLAVSTIYDVFVFVNSGVLTFDFWSTTSAIHMIDTTPGNAGIEVRSNGEIPDSTHSLVGKVLTNVNGEFASHDDAIPALGVISWFNPVTLSSNGALVQDTVSFGVTQELQAPVGRVNCITFARPFRVDYFGNMRAQFTSAVAYGLDGEVLQLSYGATGEDFSMTLTASNNVVFVKEGVHQIAPYGQNVGPSGATDYTDTFVECEVQG
jgi:hypothetical protein